MKASLATLVLLAIAAPATALAEETIDLERAAATYDRACSECHRSAERLAARLDRLGEPLDQSVDGFLVDHHAADPELRAEIVAYLLHLASTD